MMQVCGNARVWGDGIIPIEAAHLDGKPEPTIHASCLSSQRLKRFVAVESLSMYANEQHMF